VVFEEVRNADTSCQQSLNKSNGAAPAEAGDSEFSEIEDTDEIDIFGLPHEEIHLEIIDKNDHDDPGRADDGMIHGCTRTSGMGSTLHHGRAGSEFEETIGLPHNTTGQMNGQGDQSPPAAGVNTGQNHTHKAPDEDADTHTDDPLGNHHH
jgi:hypothetical protein